MSDSDQWMYRKKSVINAGKKWLQFVRLKRKLRAILAKKGKEELIDNRMEKRKKQRGEGVNEVLQAFIPMVRLKMKARAICQRQIKAFKRSLPTQKVL